MIWGATRLTLGTCSPMATASSSTRFLGKSMPWRRVSLLPGTTNSTLAPRLLSCPSARFWAPRPTPTKVITEALPMTMPSMVSKLRSRLERRVLRAMPTVSRMGSLVGMAAVAAAGLKRWRVCRQRRGCGRPDAPRRAADPGSRFPPDAGLRSRYRHPQSLVRQCARRSKRHGSRGHRLP